MFAKLFRELNDYMEAARVQGLHGIKAYIIARTMLPMKPLMSKCCLMSLPI